MKKTIIGGTLFLGAVGLLSIPEMGPIYIISFIIGIIGLGILVSQYFISDKEK